MSLTCFKNPPHKSTNCEECFICRQCWQNESQCLQKHGGGPRGAKGKRISSLKVKLREKRDGLNNSRELRQLSVPNLNEDALQQSLIEEIKRQNQASEAAACFSFARVASALSLDIPDRMSSRRSFIDKAFLDSERGRDDVIRFMRASMERIADTISGGSDAINQIIVHSYLESCNVSKSLLEELCDLFVRAKTRLEQRRHFATLNNAIDAQS